MSRRTLRDECLEIQRNLRIIVKELGVYRLLDRLQRLLTKKEAE
ncbi:hypothetical protein [Brevibacillus porteri]